MTASLPLCTAVIVTYNNAHTIGACLDSLCKHSTLPLELVVVDNSPEQDEGDGTFAVVEAWGAAHPGQKARFIRRPDNPGFGAACNLGAKDAAGRFLLFLNPDTLCDNDVPGMLAALLAENPSVRVAGPQIRRFDGGIERTCRNLPTPFRIFCDATGLDRILGNYRLLRFPHDTARAVEQVIGACLMMRREDFEAMHGFDERFFIYFEEVDLCKRVLDTGGQVWFYPSAWVRHVGGGSLETTAMLHRMPLLLRKSRAQYFAKHFGILPQWLSLGVTLVECFAKGLALAAMAFFGQAGAKAKAARSKGFFAVLKEWAQ